MIPPKKYLGGAKPFAFTEMGVAMLSGVLKSRRAIEMNIVIIRTLVALRKMSFRQPADTFYNRCINKVEMPNKESVQNSGYSATPLAKKLGIKEGFKIRIVNQPTYYFDLFTVMPENISILADKKVKKNLIHYFTKQAKDLHKDITSLKNEIEQDGAIWISWPKKASKVTTDITEDFIRELALANGLVDIKVCAVDETWSGLKLVIPVKNRKVLR